MGCWLYTKDLNIQVDTERAIQTLIEDGWERTSTGWQKREERNTKRLNFVLTVNSNDQTKVAVAENIKEQLSNVDIQITIRYLAGENYLNAINNRDFDIALTGLRLGYSPNLKTFFGNGNIANYNNQEVLDIMQAVENTTDENVLYEKYARLYDIYLEEAPYIGLYRNTETIISNQGLVSNLKANCFNIYHNIEKWYRQ